MLFCIKTLNDNGTGYTYPNKELLMEHISTVLDYCIENGATYVDFEVKSDVKEGE